MARRHSGRIQPEGVIQQVYAAALDDALWAPTLMAAADCLGAVGATVEIIDKTSAKPVFFHGAGLADDGMADYVAHYAAICPRLPHVDRNAAGHVSYDGLFISEAEMDRNPFYAEFLPRDDLRYFIAGTLRNDAHCIGLITAQRTPRQGHVEAEDIAAMHHLLPHFGQALDLHVRLRAQTSRAGALETTLDQLAAGVVLLDARGRVLFCNRAAANLLAKGDGLTVDEGALRPSAGWAARELGRAIERALRTRSGDDAEAGGDLLAPRADGQPALILAVRPLPRTEATADLLYVEGSWPAIAVFIQDPAGAAPTVARILADVFKLTPAEIRLALALYRGTTLKRYAADHDISVNTVRSHLARAMRKTGTHRQAELIRLISTIDLPAR